MELCRGQMMCMTHPLRLALVVLCFALPLATPLWAQDEDPWSALIIEGQTLLQAVDPAAALELFHAAREIVEAEHRDDEDVIVTATSLGLAYGAMGEFTRAVEQHTLSLELRIASYGEPSQAVAIGLRHLAKVMQNQALYADTSTLLNRALTNLEGIGEGEGADAMAIRADLASIYYAVARYDDALALYEDLLAEARHGSPEGHVSLMIGAAAVHEAMERPVLARNLLDEALIIARSELPAPHPEAASVLNRLGENLRHQGRSEEALLYYEEALAMRLMLYGETDSRVAPVLNNIGLAYFNLGRLAEARLRLDAALLVTTSVFGNRHPAVAIVLGNLADVLEAQGELLEAVEANQFAMLVLEAANGTGHPEVARLRASFGRRLLAGGVTELAEPELAAALDVLESTFGRQHGDVAAVLASQAELARLTGDFDAAVALNMEAGDILQAVGLGESLDMADVLEARAETLMITRQLEDATDLYAEALAIREAQLGADNPRLAPLLRDYAFALRRLQETALAEEMEGRAAALEVAD